MNKPEATEEGLLLFRGRKGGPLLEAEKGGVVEGGERWDFYLKMGGRSVVSLESW